MDKEKMEALIARSKNKDAKPTIVQDPNWKEKAEKRRIQKEKERRLEQIRLAREAKTYDADHRKPENENLAIDKAKAEMYSQRGQKSKKSREANVKKKVAVALKDKDFDFTGENDNYFKAELRRARAETRNIAITNAQKLNNLASYEDIRQVANDIRTVMQSMQTSIKRGIPLKDSQVYEFDLFMDTIAKLNELYKHPGREEKMDYVAQFKSALGGYAGRY